MASSGVAGGKMRICGHADVVTGNLRMLLRINIRKLPCLTSAKYSCLISDVKSPFISLNVTVLATNNLRTNLWKNYDTVWTCEEKLALNLRKTFKQCIIRCFVSAVWIRILPVTPADFPRNFAPQITRYNIRRSAFYPRPSGVHSGQ